MKKKYIVFIGLFVVTFFIISFCYFRYSAISGEIINLKIEQVDNENTILDVFNVNDEYLKKFKDSPQDFYIAGLIFNVKNNSFVSCRNWKVSIKNYDDSCEIFYNDYVAQGGDYVVAAKSSVEHLGMSMLIYKKNSSVENIEQIVNENISLQTTCYPCLL